MQINLNLNLYYSLSLKTEFLLCTLARHRELMLPVEDYSSIEINSIVT